MKKILMLLLSFAVVLSAFTACSKNDTEGSVCVVIATEEPTVFEVPLSEIDEEGGLEAALIYLQREKGIEYDATGGFLNKVGELENNYETGTYIYIYTSVESDFDVSEYKTEIEYEGKTLVSSGVGVNDMSLIDGAVIYIGIIVW